MRENIKKTELISRTLISNPKASKQASISDVLQAYVNRASTNNSLQRVTQFAEREKLIEHTAARERWVAIKRPNFVVKNKYKTDHVLDQVTAKTAKDASAIRFQADGMPDKPHANWHNMTWTECTETKVQNKANSSTNRKANTHRGEQQITVELKNIKSRTVSPICLYYREIGRYKDYFTFTSKTGSKVYVSFDAGTELNETIYGVGKWVPETGTGEIYHYGGSVINEMMTDKYRTWIVDEKDTLLRPKVTPK